MYLRGRPLAVPPTASSAVLPRVERATERRGRREAARRERAADRAEGQRARRARRAERREPGDRERTDRVGGVRAGDDEYAVLRGEQVVEGRRAGAAEDEDRRGGARGRRRTPCRGHGFARIGREGDDRRPAAGECVEATRGERGR